MHWNRGGVFGRVGRGGTKAILPGVPSVSRLLTRMAARVLAVGVLLGAASASTGCRVDKDDLHRWKSTLNGPDKLVSVLQHDKYEKDLRIEAAWSLIEMKKRGGQAVGLTRLIEELQKLPVGERKEILDGLWKRLAPKVTQPLQPAGEGRWADPSVPHKDATFALYSDDKLDLDPKLRDDMTKHLNEWAVGRKDQDAEKRLVSFETRMDNAAQAYGVEQILRKLGLPAARELPSLMTAKSAIKSQRLDSIARIVVDVKPPAGDKAGGDAYEKARDELSANFAAILKSTMGDGYIDAVKPEIEDALRKAPNGKQVLDNPQAYKEYLNKARDERLTQLFTIAKLVGRKPIVDALLAIAADDKADGKHRAFSLAALEGNLDTTSDSQLKGFLAIAKSSAPDEVKHGALVRISSYPPDQATRAFYELFDAANWKVRFDGASSIIELMRKVGDKTKTTPKEFLAKLPTDPKVKFALGEPTSYGSDFGKLPPALNAKAAVDEFLKVEKKLPAQLTALGYYMLHGTKADLPMLSKFDADKTPVPKCEAADECGWDKPGCPVPKSDKPDDVEWKPVATLGEYVQFCVKPEIEKRAKAPAPAPQEGSK